MQNTMVRKSLKRSQSSVKTVKKVIKKPLTMFKPKVRTRHPTHSPLRRGLGLLPFKSVVRLGSTTIEADAVSLGGRRVECNTVHAVRNSASKLLMKQCFTTSGVKTADWWDAVAFNKINKETLSYPIISKSLHGSRGQGNVKHDTREQLESWLRGKTVSHYIFEKFVSMSREYRLHVTSEGCFYTCRKLIRNDAPEGTWQRHDDVCTWILESNPSFKKPRNWDLIVADCVKALKALGLDIGAFDVMVQGSKNGVERSTPEWIICESCSAPSFGEVTTQKYLEEIPKVLRRKNGSRI